MVNNIMDFITVFIGLAILLSIGVVILGNGLQDCKNIPGYNTASPDSSTGWAKTCLDNAQQAQNSYDLLSVILVVVAAVAILAVVRLL